MDFEKNIYAFIKELKKFDYKISSSDRIWDVIFPDQKEKWHHVRVTKYGETFYVFHRDDSLCTLEVILNKSVKSGESFGISVHDDGRDDIEKAWGSLVTAVRKWLSFVGKDWIKANKKVRESYPLNYRRGTVPNSLIRASLKDIYRIDKALGKAKTKKFIKLVEDGYFHDKEKTTRESMSAKDFFDYCKIAYIAGQEKDGDVDESMSGKEMYKRYADGRDEGLLDIAENSKKEFADWIDETHPKRERGGHPWEIRRGGNTTHIDMHVSRPSYYVKEGFSITLRGASISRLKETICMFLGIYDAGLPISIAEPETIRKRLLAEDNIGIIPSFDSQHRANQNFYEHEDVHDVLYYDDLGKYKRRIKPFITWEPLPILKPANAFAKSRNYVKMS